MKIEHGNQCIMLFKWEWCDLLLIDNKENANLEQVDVTLSTLMNHFSNLFEIFRVTCRHVLAKTTTGRCSLKEADPKL